MSVDGAKKTLDNRCLRFAKPSEYDDLEDMTAGSLFPDEIEAALTILSNEFVDLIVNNLNATPTCSENLRPKVIALQKIFRENPSAAQAVKDEMKKTPDLNAFNVDYWRTRAQAFVDETNEFMQRHRVLCVSTNKASDRIWNEYAQKSRGIVLRIEPNVQKDSKFQKFAPVTYQQSRPPIFANTLDFAREGLFGDQAARARSILDRIIYAKTNAYSFESEYRLAIFLGEGEADYRTLAYHPEEITEIYLGAKMLEADRNDIVAKARAVNPAIRIFETSSRPLERSNLRSTLGDTVGGFGVAASAVTGSAKAADYAFANLIRPTVLEGYAACR